MRRHSWSLVLLLVLQGCAYQTAVKRAETAAASQDWERAYDAYRFANELKPGKAAQEMDAARVAAAGAELAAAEAAAASGNFASAGEHLHKAQDRDPSHPRLEAVRSSVRESMATELQRRMASTDLRQTYEFAVLAKRIDPSAPQFEDATAALRERVADETKALVKKRMYAEARTMARTIGEVEPEHLTEGAKLDQAVTDGWVDALVDKAKEERERPGLAAVYYARAFEVGGREEHQVATQSMLKAAAPEAALAVYVDSKGDGGRHWRLRKSLNGALDASSGTKDGWSGGWDLQATIYANAERCRETRVAKPLTKDYVSGTRQVANPAHAEVSAKLKEAEKALSVVQVEVGKAQARLEVVSKQAIDLRMARDEKLRVYDTALARQLDSADQLQKAQARQAELDALAAGGEATAVTNARAQQGVTAQWTQRAADDQKALDTAKKALDAANAKLDPVNAEADRLTASTSEVAERFGAAEKVATELRQKKRETPVELTEDVHATLKYAETTWTNTCDATATVYFGTRWKSSYPKKQSFPATASTTDLEIPGHEKAEVKADPKKYTREQDDMIAEIDTTAEKAIASAVEGFVSESFNQKIEGALSSSNANSATNTLMAIYAGAPQRMDNAARTRLMAHLKATYGIENPAVLGIALADTPPPAPPAEAQAPGDAAAEATAKKED